MKVPIVLLLLVVVCLGCNNPQEKKESAQISDTAKTKVLQHTEVLSQKDSISGAGQEILSFLKSNNSEGLVRYFSEDGVFFSPYGFIDTAKSKKLSGQDFLTAIKKNWILTWGSYDGTGDPIKLTVAAYLKKFVYNADYANAEAVAYDEVVKQGNSLNNLKEVFPNALFVDYHFSGFDPKNSGMDWTSLRLVFKKENNDYFLIAIIHDQWTI